MTWKIKDDGETPKEVYNWRMYLASVCAGFGGALFGYDNAFLGGTLALPSFRTQFGLDGLSTGDVNNLSSNIIITFQAGCFFACFLALPLAETLGRRLTLIIASTVFVAGAAIQLTGHLGTFYAGRFLTGIGVGPLTGVVPLYISEISPPAFRGRCIGLFEIAYQIGGLLGFWINYGVSLHLPGTGATQWRIPVAMQLPMIGAFLLGCFFLPETPRFLIKNLQFERASAVLARLRNLPASHPYVQRELANIQDAVQMERDLMGVTAETRRMEVAKRTLRDCLRPQIAYRISVGVVTQFFGQFSGINGINYYSPSIFKSLGVVGTSTGLFATGIYGVVKFVTATVAYFFLVDRVGRKPLLLAGSAVMTVALVFVGAYIKIAGPPQTSGQHEITGGGIAACAFIYIYVIGFVGSYAGVPWILSSEAVPINVRAISSALSGATQWLFNLVVTKATPYLISDIGFGTFFFFAGWVVLGAVYVWLFVPETRGVPLEHMAAAFGYQDNIQDHGMFGEDLKRVQDDNASAQEIDRV
ncbi:MFS quinate transporter QutD [Coniochaeta sp. 2T2.1]|nr:MFS quinate transporter QutD [Coniochaeta sp. 2T2.1]